MLRFAERESCFKSVSSTFFYFIRRPFRNCLLFDLNWILPRVRLFLVFDFEVRHVYIIPLKILVIFIEMLKILGVLIIVSLFPQNSVNLSSILEKVTSLGLIGYFHFSSRRMKILLFDYKATLKLTNIYLHTMFSSLDLHTR